MPAHFCARARPTHKKSATTALNLKPASRVSTFRRSDMDDDCWFISHAYCGHDPSASPGREPGWCEPVDMSSSSSPRMSHGTRIVCQIFNAICVCVCVCMSRPTNRHIIIIMFIDKVFPIDTPAPLNSPTMIEHSLWVVVPNHVVIMKRLQRSIYRGQVAVYSQTQCL